MSKVFAIILAAGKGKRLGFNQPKSLIKLKGKALFEYSAETLRIHPLIKELVLVFPPGGRTRQESLEKGLATLEESVKIAPDDLILVHNAANPFVTADEITTVISAALEYKASAVAHKIVDTIKEIGRREKGEGRTTKKVVRTLDRSLLWAMQTPQVVRYDLLNKALSLAEKKRFTGTDELSLIEKIGVEPVIVNASPHNRKITTPDDFKWARFHVGDFPNVRSGFGEDSHMFDRTHRGLKLGGLKLPKEYKLAGNSDGDVILHAMYNAIAQTIGAQSLGSYADKQCMENGVTDSREYIKHILKKMRAAGFELSNIALSIEAKTPQIDPIADEIKRELSALSDVPVHSIGITAHSGEGLTACGRGEGVKASVSVVVREWA